MKKNLSALFKCLDLFFCDWTDILKRSPYAKYTKDIVTNKRKIPEAKILAMLANYTFKGGIAKN